MELPKYITKKILQQQEYIEKAKELTLEIDNWCEKSGIDIWSDEYKKSKVLINAVTPISKDNFNH